MIRPLIYSYCHLWIFTKRICLDWCVWPCLTRSHNAWSHFWHFHWSSAWSDLLNCRPVPRFWTCSTGPRTGHSISRITSNWSWGSLLECRMIRWVHSVGFRICYWGPSSYCTVWLARLQNHLQLFLQADSQKTKIFYCLKWSKMLRFCPMWHQNQQFCPRWKIGDWFYLNCSNSISYGCLHIDLPRNISHFLQITNLMTLFCITKYYLHIWAHIYWIYMLQYA